MSTQEEGNKEVGKADLSKKGFHIQVLYIPNKEVFLFRLGNEGWEIAPNQLSEIIKYLVKVEKSYKSASKKRPWWRIWK